MFEIGSRRNGLTRSSEPVKRNTSRSRSRDKEEKVSESENSPSTVFRIPPVNLGISASVGSSSVWTRRLPNPALFPKTRRDVPPFYILDGRPVVRNPPSLPVELSFWDVPWADYCPTVYTAQVVIDNDITTNPVGWADPHINGLHVVKPNGRTVKEEITTSELRVDAFGIQRAALMNAADGIKLRFSHAGPMRFDLRGYPINPVGRTGLDGRGFLGNWGPNHAADPVVGRVRKYIPDPETFELMKQLSNFLSFVEFDKNGKPNVYALQFVLIKRKDNDQWALPGGMVEAGQTIAEARTKEFAQEAMAYDQKPDESEAEHKVREKVLQAELKRMFTSTVDENDVLYKGVVDDPRNTDKSWMETVAILTFLTGSNSNLRLEAGDDAGKAKWKDYDPEMKLFASHKQFIDEAVLRLQKRGIIDEEFNVTLLGRTTVYNP